MASSGVADSYLLLKFLTVSSTMGLGFEYASGGTKGESTHTIHSTYTPTSYTYIPTKKKNTQKNTTYIHLHTACTHAHAPLCVEQSGNGS